jgi:putative molybdopterin biosynthesis protein
MERELLTAVEVAEVLRVSRYHVYDLVRDGRLPAVRIGRHVRIARSVLDAWIGNGGTCRMTANQ